VRLQLRRQATRALVLATALTGASAHAQAPPDHAPSPPGPSPPIEAEQQAAAAPGGSTVTRARSEVGAYGDTDHVFVLTPGISGSVASPTGGWSVGGSYLVDVVSAASVDIVSTASRRWSEVRQAGGVDASWKPRSFGIAPSAAFSFEPDYTSINGGVVLTQDLLAKNLTLSAGYEHGHDIAGRSGTPYSIFAHVIDHDTIKGGLTLVLDPATIATGIVEAGAERGDTSKPYRYIPLFAPGTSVARGASIDVVNATRAPERVLEQLPTSRNRFAFTARFAHRFSSATLRLDERLYGDTWSLFASTTDARFLVDVTPRIEIGPHVRVHVQTPVSFWQRVYVVQPGFDFPALRTGDRELGPLYNATAGGRIRLGLGPVYDAMQWAIGFDANATYTSYLDDLYVTSRVAVVSALSLEGKL
jgi:hypothetical protein